MLQAAGAAGNLLQIISLVIYIIKLILLGGTPRSVWGLRYTMQTPTWGQTFPNVTIVAIISECRRVSLAFRLIDVSAAISYMIISPIINGLAVAAFFMLYEIYKYLYIWVVSTGGSHAGSHTLTLAARADRHSCRVRYGWSVLSQGHHPSLRRHVHPASCVVCLVLPCARSER